jgi:dynein regulatory complex protein 1
MEALRMYSDNIEKLVRHMRTQYIDLRKNMSFELREIENAFMQEREEMLKTNAEEMESFFDKHKTDEDKEMERREQRENDHADLLDKLRSEKVNA